MAEPDRPRRAFISHSSKDDRYVTELDQFLRACDFAEVFNDGHSIHADAEFEKHIEAAIVNCDRFVVVLSHDSTASFWVDKEVKFARDRGKRVIGVRIDDCKIPAEFLARDILDFRPGRGERIKIAPSRITRHAARKLFGREIELETLDAAWADPKINVFTLVAWGGAGKTALVSEWIKTRFQANGWPNLERYFDWSFYSQGTGENRQTSSDQFMNAALIFFGDADPTKGSLEDRGERLGNLIRRQRTLLVLDGIEPLQYPPTDKSGQAGRLKDPGIEWLLHTLAADNPGLVVVTTREHLKNLDAHATADERKLDKLTKEAAVGLLRHLQIVGTEEEMHAAWHDAGGHALSLQLLGRFIADAYPHDRDIRRYREIDWTDAEEYREGRSAFKVMIAYEAWLANGGDAQRRELAILRLTGLFDRPMSAGCQGVLRAAPAITGLTESLVGLKEIHWNLALKRLADVDLLSVTADSIDAHPLIREYFEKQLRDTMPDAFRAAHSRLFDHLCESTEYRPDTLKGLEPLYEAVNHGCHAGRHVEVLEIYTNRILRGTGHSGFYSSEKLGAVGADLAAVAAFFEEPWNTVTRKLSEIDRAWLLSQASFSLMALTRLTEAFAPRRAGLSLWLSQQNWTLAAIDASNLCTLELSLGRLVDATESARQSVNYADRNKDGLLRIGNRSALADALQQIGQRAEAGKYFAEAEQIQKQRQPEYKWLYSLRGFRYCDWHLAPPERAAWQVVLGNTFDGLMFAVICDEVAQRGQKMFDWRDPNDSLLDVALDHLTLARVAVYRAILTGPLPLKHFTVHHVAESLCALRNAGSMLYRPLGLLTAALYHFVRGEHSETERYLNEALLIAQRGPMPLVEADVYLHRARLFRDKAALDKAAKLIGELGYGRRDDELEDAKIAAELW